MTLPDRRARLKPVGHTLRSPVNTRPPAPIQTGAGWRRGAPSRRAMTHIRRMSCEVRKPPEREKLFLGCRRHQAVQKGADLAYSIANQREQRMKVLRTTSLIRIIVSDFYEGGSSEALLFGKSYSSVSQPSSMHRKLSKKKELLQWPKLCSWSAVAWRLKASFVFTIHLPMTKTGSTWIRCVAPAAAVDPRVVRGRSPPPGGATRLGLWIGVWAHRLVQAGQA